ncbi:hypothetical protein CR66_05770 [Campylobacter mucosalis]|uniref:AMIN domain-containing protein n=1 Tax=Campylobacter mucosalis TaxID=202 RepID=UPI0004DAFD51|nr:AMIN domain-containing protein [Campylobacter mucosalis]KEA45905.1 hypothetical protein CR66_05770 [Campylobacter mucosalis]QKF62441.1 AMIN domain-containing protein [Campylobacter mucosalis]
MRIFYLLFIFFGLLFGRENPFLPTSELNTSVMSTNLKDSFEEFHKQEINFPTNANLLLDVSFSYRVDDGSIKHKRIDINKTIDKNAKYILIKEQAPQEMAKNLDVSVTIPKPVAQDINITKDTIKRDTIAQIAVPSVTHIDLGVNAKKQDVNISKKSKKTELDVKFKSKNEIKNDVKFLNFIDFKIDDLLMKINTKDKVIKHFAYDKHKIVIDFKQPHTAFKTKTIKLENKAFKNVTIGWHKNSYRVVIELNDRYKYTLKNSDNGYEVELKK